MRSKWRNQREARYESFRNHEMTQSDDDATAWSHCSLTPQGTQAA
jgi:hypothetical protein